MSKAVVYTGREEEFVNDEEVTDVTVADGFTEIKQRAFSGCTGLTTLSFLEGSAITTVSDWAFQRSGIASLQGMEDVNQVGPFAFYRCKDLRTIEGLGCEEMGEGCFSWCTVLQSMKGWPASMTVIPAGCFQGCSGMTAVDCDLSHVTSIGRSAFARCTSLLPPSLATPNANSAAILAYLKRKSKDERMLARYAVYASVRRARDQEEEERTDESPAPLAFALAKLPPDMNRLIRVIIEFKLGVVVQR
jgi:hypothetical protein